MLICTATTTNNNPQNNDTHRVSWFSGLSKHACVAWSRGSGHTLIDMRPPWLVEIVIVDATTPPAAYVACTP